MIKAVESKRFIKNLFFINKESISERTLKRNHAFLALFLALSSPSWGADAQKHVDHALRQYGKDVEKIVSQSQKLQQDVLGEVEDFLDHPERTETPTSSRSRSSSSQSPLSSGENEEEETQTLLEPSRCSSCRIQKREGKAVLQDSLHQSRRPSLMHAYTSQKDLSQNPSSNSLKSSPSSAKPSFFPPAETQTLVFVSLSMPRLALQQLSQAAHKHTVRLILQGLPQNSFQETSKIFQDLGISAEIDPTLFDTFDIKTVPTFIRCAFKDGTPVFQPHDRLSGNVPLSYALEKFDREGEVHHAS